MNSPFRSTAYDRLLNTLGAWTLGLVWFLPLIYAIWSAFHPSAYAARFDLFAPLTLENFANAWSAATKPSPVVAWSVRMMWPDCSPPTL